MHNCMLHIVRCVLVKPHRLSVVSIYWLTVFAYVYSYICFIVILYVCCISCCEVLAIITKMIVQLCSCIDEVTFTNVRGTDKIDSVRHMTNSFTQGDHKITVVTRMTGST